MESIPESRQEGELSVEPPGGELRLISPMTRVELISPITGVIGPQLTKPVMIKLITPS